MVELRLETPTRFVNHARDIFDRTLAVPSPDDQRWWKHAYMTEILAPVHLPQNVLDRWTKRLSVSSTYSAFVRAEMRLREI